jgi:hypothetical protein
MPSRPATSAALRRTDHHQELLELLEARDRRAEEWRETTREHREEMRALDSRIIRVRDILAGRDHHQEEIPGTTSVALPPAKKEKKTSKKFPQGGDLRERCTECGQERGEHAGSRCPPVEPPDFKTATKEDGARAARALTKRLHHEEDDDPAKPLTVIDEVEGVTYQTSGRKSR